MQKAANDLIDKSDEDASELSSQVFDLSNKWDRVTKLSHGKQARIEEALVQVRSDSVSSGLG